MTNELAWARILFETQANFSKANFYKANFDLTGKFLANFSKPLIKLRHLAERRERASSDADQSNSRAGAAAAPSSPREGVYGGARRVDQEMVSRSQNSLHRAPMAQKAAACCAVR